MANRESATSTTSMVVNLQGKNIVLTGMYVSSDDGRRVFHRMVWTPKDDGTAYQLWDFSRDGGKTWAIIYEGFLRKAKKPFPREQFKGSN